MARKKALRTSLEEAVQDELKSLADEVRKLGDGDSDILEDKLDKLEKKIGQLKNLGVLEAKIDRYKNSLDKIK